MHPRETLTAGIANRALAGRPTISATAAYKFTQSPFAAWCDAFAPKDERDELDDFTKLLFEQGREHEARVVAARFPTATSVAYDTEEEGFRLALADMAQGLDAIHGAPLFWLPEGLHGKADVLERREGAPSVFGSYHYTVKEIKLAKNIRAHHTVQAAFYNRILGLIQGFTPAQIHIVNRDHEEIAFSYDEPALLATIHGVRAILNGLKPAAVHGEGQWPWQSYTDRAAEDARDVSLVGGVGPTTRGKLAAAGIATVEALAAARGETLTAIRGVGDKTASKLQVNARAIVERRHIPLGKVAFDAHPTEIFLDLEGTGTQTTSDGLVELDYLIGALVRRDGRETYHSFVAESVEREAGGSEDRAFSSPLRAGNDAEVSAESSAYFQGPSRASRGPFPGNDAEGEMWHAFLAWLATQDGYVLYHWHHYEVTHFRKLAERHGIPPQMHARVFGKMRDLFKDATGAFAFPTYSQSIKKIAPYAGFEWRQKDVNAMASIALYFEYTRSRDRAKLQKVLDYNEDDCIAMRVVKDWLVENGT